MFHTLSYYGSVNASSRNTFVSTRLNFPYVIDQIQAKYALGHNALVQHKIFVSIDPVVVTSGEPQGLNVFEQYGSVDYIAGDDNVEILKDNTVVDYHPTWIKVLAINTDTVVHTVNIRIIVNDYLANPAMMKLKEKLGASFSEELYHKPMGDTG